MFSYKTKGTCSREIQLEIQGDTIENVRFVGGCPGNTQGIEALARGRRVDDLIHTLKGIDCGGRGTSCPDQLAQALLCYKQLT